MISIELDAFERRHITCASCNQQQTLLRINKKNSWYVKCQICNKEWSELSIRNGTASGIQLLGD